MALRHGRRAALTITATAGLVAAAMSPAGTAFAKSGPAAASARHTISAAPAWATHVTPSGQVPGSQTVHAKVWLAPRDAATLAKLAAAVSNPGSASYGDYLTEPQYAARFAPTAAQVTAVQQWLKGAGLSVEGVGPDNHFVAVAGSPSAIDSAFGTSLAQFQVNGVTAIAPTTSLTAPSSVAGSVAAVTGLDTLAHWAHTNIAGVDDQGSNNGHRVNLGPTGGFVNATPCSSYYGEKVATDLPAFNGETLPYAVCGYTPSQLRDAYGVTASGKTGAGVTVAITDAFVSQTLEKDANTYAVRQGDAPFGNGQFSNHAARGFDPQRVSDCGGNGWYGEQTLDVEAIHAVAPAANVAYYGAASCYDDDLMAAMAQAVTDNQASLVSNSWGEPTYVDVDGVVYPTIDASLVSAYESILQQGAVQGIGFYFSSGDDGDEAQAYGLIQTDYPTSDPWVTSVGGTAVGIGADGNRTFETGWGTDKYSLSSDGTAWKSVGWLYGAGGGCFVNPSSSDPDSQATIDGLAPLFAKPDWQTAATGCENRAVPDISAIADPTTGMLVGETQMFYAQTAFGKGAKYGEYRIGGTSLASPVVAGINADAQQGGNRIGFANPRIYRVGAAATRDVTSAKPDAGNIRADYANGLNADDGYLYSVRTFDDDSSLTTGPGWDDVSGVGSPTAGYIAAMHLG